MRTLKSWFAVVAAVLPLLYFGYLLYYFLDVGGGSVEEIETNGLGPTLIGLGVIALFFFILLIVKIVRTFAGPRSPGSDGSGSADGSAPSGKGEFDADAVVARYMAARQAEAPSGSPAAPRTRGGTESAKRTGFGRKNR